MAATSTGDSNYVLFGGGYGSTYYDTVDAYNTSLSRSNPTVLKNARYYLAAARTRSYAIFFTGHNSGTIDAYNNSLTRSNPTGSGFVTVKKYGATSTYNNDYDYALFGGGQNATYSSTVSTVIAINNSLTFSFPPSLSQARWGLAAASNGRYILFAGGTSGSICYNIVDFYDSINLTTSRTESPLSAAVSNLASASSSRYGRMLFGGGSYLTNGDEYTTDIVNLYDGSATKNSIAGFGNSYGVKDLAATSLGRYIFFGGGTYIYKYNGSSYTSNSSGLHIYYIYG